MAQSSDSPLSSPVDSMVGDLETLYIDDSGDKLGSESGDVQQVDRLYKYLLQLNESGPGWLSGRGEIAVILKIAIVRLWQRDEDEYDLACASYISTMETAVIIHPTDLTDFHIRRLVDTWPESSEHAGTMPSSKRNMQLHKSKPTAQWSEKAIQMLNTMSTTMVHSKDLRQIWSATGLRFQRLRLIKLGTIRAICVPKSAIEISREPQKDLIAMCFNNLLNRPERIPTSNEWAVVRGLLELCLVNAPQDLEFYKSMLAQIVNFREHLAYQSALKRPVHPLARGRAEREARSNQYPYHVLADGMIRVLTLAPMDVENSSQDLFCSVNVLDFRKQSALNTFDAVSYVWGDEDFSEYLYCDGVTSVLKITPRLFSILKHLRVRETDVQPRNFWIDAICINQRDDTEKGHQVSMMSKIYRRASTVHVFLTDAKVDWYLSEWFNRTWGK